VRRGANAAGGALSVLDYAVIAAFSAAAAGTLLDWVTVGSFGANGWKGDSQFRVAAWLDMTDPIDALIVVAAAIAGAAAVLMGTRLLQAVKAPIVMAAGLALVIVGALEVYYILDQDLKLGNVGLGVWVIVAGGGAAIFLGLSGRRTPS
jgi:hypothetical protein